MNKSKNNQVGSIPRWQSDRMRSLLAEGWPSVWQVVEIRAKNSPEPKTQS